MFANRPCAHHGARTFARHGLIHRDIKPANIVFIGGVPKLADIGLVTDAGEGRTFVGTEGYFPSEGPGALAADIYSLGKVLYELATGRDRLDFPELPTNLGDLPDRTGLLKLNEIILKACASDPAKRYTSATEVYADLLLLKVGKRVGYTRWLEKRLTHLSRAAAVAILLVVFAGGGYWWFVQQKEQSIGAEMQRQVELARNLQKVVELLDPDGRQRQTARDFVRQRADDKRFQLQAVCTLSGQELTSQAQWSPTENSFAVVTRKGNVLIFSSEGKALRELTPPGGRVSTLSYTSDGKRLLAGTRQGKVLLWNLVNSDMQEVFTNVDSGIGRVAWLSNPDRGVATSDLLQTTNSLQSGVIFRVVDGEVLAKFSSRFLRGDFQTLATSRDGRLIGILEVPGQNRAGFLLDSEKCEIKAKLFDGEYSSGPLSISIAPDNNTVAVGYAPFDLSLWDGAQQKELRLVKAHSNWVTSLGFSPDSKLLISGAGDSTARIWEVQTGKEIGRIRFEGASTYVNSVGFSADGGLVLAAGENDVIVIAKAPK